MGQGQARPAGGEVEYWSQTSGVTASPGAQHQLAEQKRQTLLQTDSESIRVVRRWLNGQVKKNCPEEKALAKVAAEWLVDAVNHAYLDGNIEKAAVDLLVTRNFTTSMKFLNVFDDPFRAGLKANIDRLGLTLKGRYDELDLGTALGQSAIDDLTTYHELERFSGKGRAINQIDVLPDFPAAFIEERGNGILKQYAERCYLLATMLVGIAANDEFQSVVREVATSVGLSEDAVRSAPYKSYVRALSRMDSAEHHRNLPKPRTAHNADLIRNLVAAMTPDMCKAFYAALNERFDGVTRVENHYAQDDAERSKRSHLLALDVTVVYDTKTTFSELCKRPEVKKAWGKYIGVPQGEPSGRWGLMCEAAQRYLESPEMADRPVTVLGEVKIMLVDFAAIRHEMQLPLKAFTAKTCVELFSTFLASRPDAALKEERATTLYNACARGQMEVAERLLGKLDHDVNEGNSKATPLYAAAANNHLDMCRLLLFGRLSKGADPNLAKTDTGASPLFIAAQNGYVDVAETLLSKGAEMAQLNKQDRSSLNVAAARGHLDVVQLLVEHNANVNTKGRFGTPLDEAMNNRQLDVATYLKGKGARGDPAAAKKEAVNRKPSITWE